MPVAAEVIDLADEDDEEFYESIDVPEDIEAIEAMPRPSRQRNGSGQGRRTPSANSMEPPVDGFDARQEIKMEMAKVDAEVRHCSVTRLTMTS